MAVTQVSFAVIAVSRPTWGLLLLAGAVSGRRLLGGDDKDFSGPDKPDLPPKDLPPKDLPPKDKDEVRGLAVHVVRSAPHMQQMHDNTCTGSRMQPCLLLTLTRHGAGHHLCASAGAWAHHHRVCPRDAEPDPQVSQCVCECQLLCCMYPVI